VKRFGRRPIATVGQALGPSSESPQAGNRRASPPVGHHLASATPIDQAVRTSAGARSRIGGTPKYVGDCTCEPHPRPHDRHPRGPPRACERACRTTLGRVAPQRACTYVRGTVLRALAPSHWCRQRSADSWRSGLPSPGIGQFSPRSAGRSRSWLRSRAHPQGARRAPVRARPAGGAGRSPQRSRPTRAADRSRSF